MGVLWLDTKELKSTAKLKFVRTLKWDYCTVSLSVSIFQKEARKVTVQLEVVPLLDERASYPRNKQNDYSNWV